MSSNLAGSATSSVLPWIFTGASARLNILLNTERIVEKSSRPQPVAWGSREDRLAYARGPMAGSAFVFVKQASKRSGLSRLPQVKCPLWLP